MHVCRAQLSVELWKGHIGVDVVDVNGNGGSVGVVVGGVVGVVVGGVVGGVVKVVDVVNVVNVVDVVDVGYSTPIRKKTFLVAIVCD